MTSVADVFSDYRTKIRTTLETFGGKHDEVEIYGGEPGDLGLAGGPDFWQVHGLSGGDTLNVRSGPSSGNSVVGRLVEAYWRWLLLGAMRSS